MPYTGLCQAKNSGGGAGNRTRVLEPQSTSFYMHSPSKFAARLSSSGGQDDFEASPLLRSYPIGEGAQQGQPAVDRLSREQA